MFNVGDKVHTNIDFAEDNFNPFSSKGQYYEGIIELHFPEDKYLIRLNDGKSKLIKGSYLDVV